MIKYIEILFLGTRQTSLKTNEQTEKQTSQNYCLLKPTLKTIVGSIVGWIIPIYNSCLQGQSYSCYENKAYSSAFMLFKIINAAVLDAYHAPVTILGPGDKQMKKNLVFMVLTWHLW